MFEVDHKGLAKLVAGRGKEFILFELFQNAADEDGVSRIDIKLARIPRTPYVGITVEDDAPEGFHDIAHAYTLFAESKKKGDPSKRGRFNLGEKLVIALFEEAMIATTKGTVEFEGGVRHNYPRRKQQHGTTFSGNLRMTDNEFEAVSVAVRRLIVPDGIVATLNGEVIPSWDDKLITRLDVTLPTVIAGEEGIMRPTRRRTEIALYETGDATGFIYEMGIPVVACDLPCHVNVMQKVPLNTDRDNVTPAYAKELSAYALNAYAELLTAEQATAPWISQAIEHDAIEDAAVARVLTKRYGEKRVIYDPSDPEGTKIAMSRGYTVIPGRSFSKDAWARIRSAGAALPAGQVTPSPKPYSDDPNAPMVDVVPRDEWTEGMVRIVAFTELMAEKLMGVTLRTQIVNTRNSFSAAYCRVDNHSGEFDFNIGRLGRKWFDRQTCDEAVLDLIIHEFGHQFSGDHLSSDYYKALTKLGAQMTRLALSHPEVF